MTPTLEEVIESFERLIDTVDDPKLAVVGLSCWLLLLSPHPADLGVHSFGTLISSITEARSCYKEFSKKREKEKRRENKRRENIISFNG
ncbi:hypothetical protein HAX54_052824 [Datura stramonium]|uniref:Uncharacterized protein n=1 Tax=Datura stramonium TaxID=4076 RepID=A0ABS8T0A0_DATST|nr:hypothetical protein [Datura stramonium]